MPEIKSICVYCGSNPGSRPDYVEAARTLGTAIAARGITLVYGGAKVGCMGAVADAALAAGGKVVGIIPRALVEKEIAHEGLTESLVVGSMHERKRLMADRSDAFVALPGGIGTLEEIFEMWTWAQLGHHAKPCALYDVAGFYGPLVTFLDHQVTEGFVRPGHRGMLIVEREPEPLFTAFETYEAPVVVKWIGRDER